MLSKKRFLCIDEFARRKGHHYETAVYDLQHRVVLEVSEFYFLLDTRISGTHLQAVYTHETAIHHECLRRCGNAEASDRTDET